MFVDVVSFTPTDPSKNFFTYKITKELTRDILIGQLVSIPWGKKTSQGLVIGTKKESQVKAPKEIFKILSPTPILLPNYIKLLKWMSWYYHAPMLDCLKAMLPELPLNTKQLMTNAQSFRRSTLDVKQTLVLFPTISQAENYLANINISNGLVIYHKQLAKKELFNRWWKIYNREFVRIIGTRSAIFTQCQNLAAIKIINEDETGFKDIQSPYFDSLTTASELAKLTGAKLAIETLTPKVETYLNFSKNLVKKKPKAKPQVTIINLSNKREKSLILPISDTLRDILIEKIKNKMTVLLFLNRIKESGQTYCNECKFSGYSKGAPEVCPNCKGENFKFYSLNLKTLAQELVKIQPQIGVTLISEKGEKQFKKGTPKITLSTSAIFTKKPQKFSLVCQILADTILNLPDFSSSFRTFQMIVKLLQLANIQGQVLIQTYNPSHPAIKYSANFEFEKFYHEELILRKKLELPPYYILAKLSLKLKNAEVAKEQAENLKSLLEKKSLLVEVSEPIASWQTNGEFNIIVKAKKREELDSVLSNVPAKWKVVLDPESLL